MYEDAVPGDREVAVQVYDTPREQAVFWGHRHQTCKKCIYALVTLRKSQEDHTDLGVVWADGLQRAEVRGCWGWQSRETSSKDGVGWGMGRQR